MLKITSRSENQFIFNTIVKSGGEIWLGATNVIGTNTFKHLDISDVTDHQDWSQRYCYSSFPWQDINQSKAIVMYNDDGNWYDSPASDNHHVVCEISHLALRSRLRDLNNKVNEKVNHIDAQLQVVPSNISSLRDEFLRLINEVFNRHQDVTSELEGQFSLLNEKIRIKTRIIRNISISLLRIRVTRTKKVGRRAGNVIPGRGRDPRTVSPAKRRE